MMHVDTMASVTATEVIMLFSVPRFPSVVGDGSACRFAW